MPKHYAIDANVSQYTVYFDNTKTVTLTFPTPYARPPMIQLTMNDSGVAPVYKTTITTTSCQIKFKSNWTGEVDVLVMER
jgi:hypothetical protein